MKNSPEVTSGDVSFSHLSGYNKLSSINKDNLKIIDELGIGKILEEYHNGDEGYLSDLAKALFNMKLSGYDFPGELKDHIEYHIRVDSSKIEGNKGYRGQAEVVKTCLREAFGEYSNQIRITDSFFFDLDFFMGELKIFQDFKGDKNSEKYQELLDNVISGGNAIKGTIVHYGMKADDKMEEDLRIQGKSDTEINTIIKARYDKFLSLLKEKIVYEENR